MKTWHIRQTILGEEPFIPFNPISIIMLPYITHNQTTSVFYYASLPSYSFNTMKINFVT